MPLLRLCFLLFTATLVPAEEPFSFDTNSGHLPKSIVPSHYTVRLAPDLPNRTFVGHVRTDITVRESVDAIVLSANELEIDAARLLTAAGPVDLPSTYDETTQQLSLHPPAALAPGDYVIELEYRGVINPGPEGFFYDRYTTPDGDREMFGTQMEVPDARRVLPCWDEPAFKATFSSTLVVPESFVATSNMPAIRETALGDGRKEVEFAKSPLMSTYLLAYFGGEFEILETEHHGIKLRILTTAGKRAHGAYALEATKQLLDYYTDYFGVDYPLPQLDQIAVPNAFAGFGAMENWGCISYLETLLLFDPANSSQATKENVFTVVAHEIAHQWFGNIVTMAWWDNLWLNEAFASWIETKSTDDLNPDWGIWSKTNRGKQYAMGLDARQATHPIQLSGVTEYGAIDAFDIIAYEKGQAFVRMLENYVGETPFRDGIRLYMQRHAWSNTTTADLWAALEEASGLPVMSIASGWTLQDGFPVISASLQDDGLHLTQERFIIDDPVAAPVTWSVPVTYAPLNDLGDINRHLLADTTAVLPWPSDADPPLLNVNGVGFYRVNYDHAGFARVIAALPDLPETDQMNLVSDTWALVSAARVSAPEFLEIAWALRHSDSYSVWSAIITGLNEIDIWLWDQPQRHDYARWVIALMQPQMERLGWSARPGEDSLTGQLRSSIIHQLGRHGDEAVIATSQDRFAAFLAAPESLPGDLRDAVVDVTGRYADEATYEQLWAAYQKALTTEDKALFLSGMQRALDPALAARTRALTLGESLPVSLRNYNLYYIAATGEHLADTWAFARQHAEELLAPLARYGANSYLPRLVNRSSDPARADEMLRIQKQYRGEEALPEAEKVAGLIRVRATMRERELPGIEAWLARQRAPAN